MAPMAISLFHAQRIEGKHLDVSLDTAFCWGNSAADLRVFEGALEKNVPIEPECELGVTYDEDLVGLGCKIKCGIARGGEGGGAVDF